MKRCNGDIMDSSNTGEPQHLKGLVQEARVYREQGLLAQSRDRYLEALEALALASFEGRDALRSSLREALEQVEEEIGEVEAGDDNPPELSSEMKGLIRKLFSASEDRSIAKFKAAVALARFGQYGEALKEFNRLLEGDTLTAVAAKNILTCHLTFASPEVAISQYERWVGGSRLKKEELEEIRVFLESLLENEGMTTRLPGPNERWLRWAGADEEDDEELPLTGVTIPMPVDAREDAALGLDVFLHTGKVVCVHVPPERKDLLAALPLGSRISGMRLFSTMAMFRGNGVVLGRKRIESGPRQGHYTLDIHVEAA